MLVYCGNLGLIIDTSNDCVIHHVYNSLCWFISWAICKDTLLMFWHLEGTIARFSRANRLASSEDQLPAPQPAGNGSNPTGHRGAAHLDGIPADRQLGTAAREGPQDLALVFESVIQPGYSGRDMSPDGLVLNLGGQSRKQVQAVDGSCAGDGQYSQQHPSNASATWPILTAPSKVVSGQGCKAVCWLPYQGSANLYLAVQPSRLLLVDADADKLLGQWSGGSWLHEEDVRVIDLAADPDRSRSPSLGLNSGGPWISGSWSLDGSCFAIYNQTSVMTFSFAAPCHCLS